MRQPTHAKPSLWSPDEPLHRIFVVDCSGSMAGDLPQLRGHLKTAIRDVLRPQDLLSVVWFSGRGQCAAIFDQEPVQRASDLQRVTAAIDRWLVPVGLTGFCDPLYAARQLAAARAKTHRADVFFLSDGCDNVWPREAVLDAARILGALPWLARSTVVEYGYYADRKLLTQIAEKLGGQHVFAEDFSDLRDIADAALVEAIPAPTTRVNLYTIALDEIAWVCPTSHGDPRALLHTTDQGRALDAPSDHAVVYYLTRALGPFPAHRPRVYEDDGDCVPALYAALAIFAQRDPAIAWDILAALGDVRLIRMFGGAYGKQARTKFSDAAMAAAMNADQRGVEGIDFAAVPDPNCPTVFSVLELLVAQGAHLCLDHAQMVYQRISRQRVDADDALTPDQLARIQELREEQARTTDRKVVRALQEQIDAILAEAREALVFVPDKAEAGYPMTKLVFNEGRPNISVLVRKEGTVDVSSRLPPDAARRADFVGAIPLEIRTHTWRTYTIVKDGLVHVALLPVRFPSAEASLAVVRALAAWKIPAHWGPNEVLLIDLARVPVVNRGMIKAVTAEDLVRAEVALNEARARQKVLNALAPEAPDAPATWSYSEEVTAWLAELGITPNGFAPKMVSKPPTDFYVARVLEVKYRGMTIPSVNEVRKAVAAGKVPRGIAAQMAKLLAEAESWDAATRIANRDAAQEDVRARLRAKSRAVFSVVLGNALPADALEVAVGDLKGSVAVVDEEIWI